MGITTCFRKAVMAGNLARGKQLKLGNNVYRVKGLFANAIALQNFAHRHEPWLDTVFRSVLQCREGVFLDVGVNLGQTMFKILAMDSSRRYIGFEPQSACCFMIQRFLDDNHIANFTILPIGLSNGDGILKLHRAGGDHDDTASVVEGFRPESFYSSYRYVCVRKGDDVVSELNLTSLCAIKVDVEGAELEVFEGLLDTIVKTKPFLIFEVLNHFLAVTGRTLDDSTIRFREARIERMETILRQCDYEIFNIQSQNQLNNVSKIEPKISADLSLTNYIGIPRSALDMFSRVFPGSLNSKSVAYCVEPA